MYAKWPGLRSKATLSYSTTSTVNGMITSHQVWENILSEMLAPTRATL